MTRSPPCDSPSRSRSPRSGPAAEAAIPRLKQVVEEDINDEVAASARRAIKRIRPEAVPPE